jgi:hypothetical protein
LERGDPFPECGLCGRKSAFRQAALDQSIEDRITNWTINLRWQRNDRTQQSCSVTILWQLNPGAIRRYAQSSNAVDLGRYAADVEFDGSQRKEPASAGRGHRKHCDGDDARGRFCLIS